MELYKKLQQYGQFGEGDVPALRDIVVLAEEVARRSEKLDELYFFTATDCDDPGPCPGDATRLLGMIEALVDGKSEAAGFDNLWATLSDTHGRWDEGEIDNATAKAECDAAIDVYKTNECLGRPPFTDQQLEDERRAFAEECDAEDPEDDTSNPLHPDDATKAKWKALIEDGAFVTMTVPVQVALMVVDNEAGDAHTNAVCNLEMMLMQDMFEEYGLDEDSAWKINEWLSNGGA